MDTPKFYLISAVVRDLFLFLCFFKQFYLVGILSSIDEYIQRYKIKLDSVVSSN